MLDGMLFIDKPKGMTSRHVDNVIQKRFGTRKVGHLGTLDPFATGLLLVSVNKGNKFLQFINDGEKAYIASLQLGIKTSTGDVDGEVIEKQDVPTLSMETVKNVLASFLGKGEQIPPMTSAIKVDGEALYKKAHKGIEIERKPRPIEVFSIDVIRFENNVLDFYVKVSAGTYIRTLGEDIAVKLGTVGHLLELRRVSIGRYDISKAKPLDDIKEDDLINPTSLVDSLKHFPVDEQTKKLVLNGIALRMNETDERLLLTYNGDAIAVYERKDDGKYHSLRGLF